MFILLILVPISVADETQAHNVDRDACSVESQGGGIFNSSSRILFVALASSTALLFANDTEIAIQEELVLLLRAGKRKIDMLIIRVLLPAISLPLSLLLTLSQLMGYGYLGNCVPISNFLFLLFE